MLTLTQLIHLSGRSVDGGSELLQLFSIHAVANHVPQLHLIGAVDDELVVLQKTT